MGLGILAGFAGAEVIGADPARGQPVPDDAIDLGLLRRTFELAVQARERGGAPYGALVADAAGNVVASNDNGAADGRNAKTIASDKAAFSGNLALGQVDWR